tara:strand:- start:78 stop:1010 length:933 start_codon:yes stop_codon:yes gene_type:complete
MKILFKLPLISSLFIIAFISSCSAINNQYESNNFVINDLNLNQLDDSGNKRFNIYSPETTFTRNNNFITALNPTIEIISQSGAVVTLRGSLLTSDLPSKVIKMSKDITITTTDDKTLKLSSEKLLWDTKTNNIHLSGDPTIEQGTKIINTSKITYLVNDNILKLTDGVQIIDPNQNQVELLNDNVYLKLNTSTMTYSLDTNIIQMPAPVTATKIDKDQSNSVLFTSSSLSSNKYLSKFYLTDCKVKNSDNGFSLADKCEVLLKNIVENDPQSTEPLVKERLNYNFKIKESKFESTTTNRVRTIIYLNDQY